MTRGESIYRTCPSCQKLLIERTLNSGNTFGARFWTDGKMVAPMLPETPALVRCAHCSALLWLADADEVSPGKRRAMPGDVQAESPVELEERDFLEALEQKLARDDHEEKYIRMKAWHARNDAFRNDSQNGQTEVTAATSDNMKALYVLLDEAEPNERVMKAELARELGRFDDAMKVLDFTFEDGYLPAVDLIKTLASACDSHVVEIVAPTRIRVLQPKRVRSKSTVLF